MEKMREELCEVGASGQLSLKPGVEWPAFLRYNTTGVLDPHGAPTDQLDLFTCLTQPPEVILKVDPAHSATVVAAREREAREATAGPDWGYFPRTPDLKTRPELRKDLKMLTQRAHWDPQQRYKSLGWERKGTNVKSNQRVSYPKFLNEGYVTLDRTYPRDNLPRALRFKSLTEQVLEDDKTRTSDSNSSSNSASNVGIHANRITLRSTGPRRRQDPKAAVRALPSQAGAGRRVETAQGGAAIKPPGRSACAGRDENQEAAAQSAQGLEPRASA